MTDQELKEAAQICIDEIKKLSPGFAIINDISKLKPASPRGAAEIKKCSVNCCTTRGSKGDKNYTSHYHSITVQ
ncbi:hypothetical protein [Reichenbachiella sp.]|uniref:hypothetical protein n=1 Tax=Reichenbachiella sp. TaxID=2184521 RepID=UPI003B5BA77B